MRIWIGCSDNANGPLWEFPDPAGKQAVANAMLLFAHLKMTHNPFEFIFYPYSMSTIQVVFDDFERWCIIFRGSSGN
jgi:hypothetical protein